LSSMTDDWGGENNTGDAITKYGTEIPDGYKWGMNFGEVERFIKLKLAEVSDKVGYSYRFDTQKTVDVGGETLTEDACYILGFADEAAFNAWRAAGGGVDDERVLTAVEIPTIGSGYAMVLNITPPASVQGGSDFNVMMTATSTYTAGGVSQEISEPVTLTIQTSYDGTTWSRRGTRIINSGVETAVPMDGLLPDGDIYVRVTATGAYTSSVAVVFQVKIISLVLAWAATANTRERTTSDESLTLDFSVTGAVLKTLVVQFDGYGAFRQSAISLPADITGTTYRMEVNPADVQDILTAGRHKIHAYLEYYADGINIVSDAVDAEYIVSDGSVGTIAINDIATGLSNFAAVTFFRWSVNKDMEVNFTLVDKYDGSVVYIPTRPQQATAHTLNTFSTQLNIEGVEDEVIYAMMQITDANGNKIHDDIQFVIGNVADYAPVTGARFILSPSVGSNDDPDRARVINSADGSVVSTSEDFVGFDWKTDGWISRIYNQASAKVLRIPAARSLAINYNPFRELTTPSTNSATFECDFIIENIIDTNEPIITIGDSDKGLVIYPDHAIMRTANLKVDSSQNVAWAEGVRVHLAVAVSFGETYSYVRIYINGVLDREFAYNPSTDTFADSTAKIVIGNTGSDIDIFGIRCYNYGLTSRQVCQDYMALMSTINEKAAFRSANDIDNDSGDITWEKCLGKYNIIGHTGPLLHFGMDNNKQKVNLEIHFAEGQEGNSIVMTNLENKGQGTTAMTYYWWNQQYSVKSDTKFYDVDDTEREHPLDLGGYVMVDGEPAAKKLVGKVNFASSMQSHKLGLTWAYTDLYKQMLGTQAFGNDAPSQFNIMGSNVRLAVYEKPFLFFQRESEGDPWVFRNLMTFGAGKGDKPTFGFKDADGKTPNMFMVEGADNNAQLALFNMPWDDDYIEYNPSEEAWCYPGTTTKNINFGFGKTDEDDLPDNPAALQSIKDFFNFVYVHSTRIEYGGNSPSQLPVVGNSYTTPQKWLGDGGVYRWDVGSNQWVQAKDMDGSVLNIVTQYNKYGFGILDTKSAADATTNIITARVAHFKAHASEYFHVRDALFHYCFIKFFAGTDNRAKNTYYYTDPTDLKIRWLQDDLDTVIKTNNSGLNIKPYWVEEHTKDSGNSNYWAGEFSSFNLLLEAAYDHDIVPNGEIFSIQTIMRAMMGAMSQLGNNSVMGFMEKYILSTQDYFPATAYNAQAKWVYEYAYENHKNPPVPPLAQSCGSQRWSEYQWLKDRIMYISSWCQYGEFQSGTSAGGQQWRAHDIAKRFTVTPAKYMYPRFGQGSSNVGTTRLVAPGEDFESSVALQAGTDEVLAIRGNNYLWKMHDMDTTHKDNDFTFSGERLREITVNADGSKTASQLMWEAASITVNARNIERFVIRNATRITTRIDLSQCVRLREIDLRGCSNLVGVDLPRTSLLTTLKFPSSFTSIEIDGQENISTLMVENTESLQTISVVGNDSLNGVVRDILADGVENETLSALTTLRLRNVDWTINSDFLQWLLEVDTVDITGIITVTGVVNLQLAERVIAKFPGLFDAGSPLTITYSNSVPITAATLKLSQYGVNPDYIGELGDYPLSLSVEPTSGNDLRSIAWSIDLGQASGRATVTDDGVLHVTKLNDVVEGIVDTNPVTVTATITTATRTITAQLVTRLYERKAQVGDLVYADGTFGPKAERNPNKTVVGVCFYSEDITDPDTGEILYHDRRMISMDMLGRFSWGACNQKNSEGPFNLGTIAGENVYDVGAIGNIWSGHGFEVNRTNYWDGEFPNGNFKTLAKGSAQADIGVKTIGQYGLVDAQPNSYVPVGRKYTLEIIALRNKILNSDIWASLDSVAGQENQATNAFAGVFTDDTDTGLASDTTGRKIPRDVGSKKESTVVEELFTALNSMKDSSGNTQKYGHLMYLAASKCYAYQPSVANANEVLADKFKAHNWYLPSAGEMCRIYWHMTESCDGNKPFSDIAGFYSLYVKADDFIWTSNEYGKVEYPWFLDTSNGKLYGDGEANIGVSFIKVLKTASHKVRPACAF